MNYENMATNLPEYGKLYTLDEAKGIALPSGWRLPTKDDYIDLMKNVGTTSTGLDNQIMVAAAANAKLRSKTGWNNKNGDNSSGFNGFPAGDAFTYATSTGLKFDSKGDYAQFWTSTSAADVIINEGIAVKHQWVFELNNTKYPDNTIDDYADVYNAAYVNLSRYSLRFVKDN